MYRNGNGIPQDNITAHMWNNITSANEHEDVGEFRDERAGLMQLKTFLKLQCPSSDKLEHVSL